MPAIHECNPQAHCQGNGILDDGGHEVSSEGFEILAVLNDHVSIRVRIVLLNCSILPIDQFLKGFRFYLISNGLINVLEAEQPQGGEY